MSARSPRDPFRGVLGTLAAVALVVTWTFLLLRVLLRLMIARK